MKTPNISDRQIVKGEQYIR